MIAAVRRIFSLFASRPRLAGASVLVLLFIATSTAYRGSLSVPFVFDDLSAVRDNPSIRQLWPLTKPLALTPQAGGAGSDGRPLVNLSLALNYAWGGLDVRGYRWFNLVAHVLTGFALWSLVHLTLRRIARTFSVASTGSAAAAVALLWLVHPLHTETLLVAQNRSEIMALLAALVALIALLRSAESVHPRRWSLLAIIAGYAGVACKETAVTLPLIALFFDRTFVAGSFRAAWRHRRTLHLGLVSSWLLLAVLVLAQRSRSGTAGFGLGVTAWHYLLTQCQAIFIYLKLSVWPDPLVFDYGLPIVQRWRDVAAQFCALSVLTGATVVALWRRPVWGFFGLAFFALLAPSSSIVPIVTQTMAEHRMYAPLAVLVAAGVLSLWRIAGPRTWLLLVPSALALITLTTRRTVVYQNELTLWNDTLAYRPENPTAWNNLGNELLNHPGRLAEAITALETAVRLRPDFAEAHYNLGTALLRTSDRLPEAIRELQQAIALKPDAALAYHNLGNALARTPGRRTDAIAAFEHALRLHPDFPEAYRDLGLTLAATPEDLPRAIECYLAALRLRPDYAAAHNSLANALLQMPGQLDEAINHYEAALRQQPDNADVHSNLGVALAMAGRISDSIAHHRAAVQLRPDYLPAHYNLALALLQAPEHRAEAITCLETVLKLNPDFSLAREKLTELRAAR